MSIRMCVEWAEETTRECSEYEDQGYEKCAAWGARCCDWWPCSWACRAVTWFCYGWYWVSNWVCVAWVWVTATICIAWEALTLILTGIGVLVSLIFTIPIIGRIIREILDILQEIFWRFIGIWVFIWDTILEVIGVRLRKKLRLCIVILRDEKGKALATVESLEPAISSAVNIYESQANVGIIVTGVHTAWSNAPTGNLDLTCGVSAWGADLWTEGSYFEKQAAYSCAEGSIGRLVGYGAAIVAFIVRRIEGTTAGCSLGPASDYVVVEGPAARCLAHEIAHACGLPHLDEPDNLANPACGGTKLSRWQSLVIRNSRHVTYV